ncbi:MAG: NAD(P)H-dependent glycerol-3-phosphate dehydrogenase [Saprospiraceae bacterium]|nr:NAD(P)H-dependent glycerol-3-phosphate dehydrogenase [Saprospiraceae bacterium]
MSLTTVGVIGSGKFGITVAKLLSRNVKVLVYTRSEETKNRINSEHQFKNTKLKESISATTDIAHICNSCQLLFAVIPSSDFRGMMRSFRDCLKPFHIMIHATKGLDVSHVSHQEFYQWDFTRKEVHTMTEVILQESNLIRVGCMSGPNLATEILAGQPAATVIASDYDEVISMGQEALSSNKFFVFGSHDLKAAEIAGAFKNIIAVASGILSGMGMGKNMQSLLITRGLREMIYFGRAMGTSANAYLGTAGIGDLIATCTSEDSRNYIFGKRLASGEDFEYIMKTSSEVVEGVRTLKIINQLAKNEKLLLPIVQVLHKVVYEGFDKTRALDFLMHENHAPDVDFL